MQPAFIIEGPVGRQLRPRLAWTLVVMQIHLLIFHAAPAPFHENVVQRPAPPIHTDAHPGRLQQLGILRTGEMAALVTVEDLRRRRAERRAYGPGHEWLRERLVQFPTDHVAAVP